MLEAKIKSLKMLKSYSNDTRRKSYELLQAKCENIIRQIKTHLK